MRHECTHGSHAIEGFFWAAGSEVVGVMPAVNERWLCDELAFFCCKLAVAYLHGGWCNKFTDLFSEASCFLEMAQSRIHAHM